MDYVYGIDGPRLNNPKNRKKFPMKEGEFLVSTELLYECIRIFPGDPDLDFSIKENRYNWLKARI